jgi:single-strand DNA-binding protein
LAASLNRVFLIGNLTRDPELRYLPSGQAVATFTLAMNRVYTAGTGERKEDTSFIRIVVWARRAEVCNEYLRKGSPAFVEGRLQSRTWEAQDGTKRSSIEVVANNVQFLGRGGARDSSAEAIQLPSEPLEGEAPEPQKPEPQKKEGPIEISKEELSPDEEVPF